MLYNGHGYVIQGLDHYFFADLKCAQVWVMELPSKYFLYRIILKQVGPNCLMGFSIKLVWSCCLWDRSSFRMCIWGKCVKILLQAVSRNRTSGNLNRYIPKKLHIILNYAASMSLSWGNVKWTVDQTLLTLLQSCHSK